MTQWIVFDAMGVIFEEGDDILNRLVPFLQQRGVSIDAESVHTVYRRASLGQISSREFWKSLNLDREYPTVQNEYLDTCLRLDPTFLEAAKLLAGRFSLAILSNDVVEWSAHLRQINGLDGIFQAAVISSEVGVRKPAPEIYRILLERLQAEGKDCLFVDDRLENLPPAAELGITPIWLSKQNRKSIKGITHCIPNLSDLPPLAQKIFTNRRSQSQ